MAKVLLKDVVMRVKDKVDKDCTSLEYYIGGEHIQSNEICITQKGTIAGSTIGPAFHMGFKAGDVLLMSRNPHLRKASMVDFDGICSDVSYVCRTKDESILLQSFLPFVMQTDDFWRFAEENKKGGLPFFLNWSDFEKYEFQLPPIEKQKELSNILWSMQNTKSAYEKLLRQTDELVKSQFIEMFGNEQNCLRLDQVCKCFCDGDWIESKDQSDLGVRLIQTGNVGDGEYKDRDDKARYISEDTFKRLNCTEVYPGDILISRLPDPIGRACIVPEMPKSITAVDCTIVRLKPDVLPSYFVNMTKTPVYRSQIDAFTTGSTRKRVSRGNLGSIMIPVPSIEWQKEFVVLAEQSDKSKFELKKSIENITNLMKSLMQQDFS